MTAPTNTDWLTALSLALGIIFLIGMTCGHVALNGGPAWLMGNEIEVFLKASGLTIAMAIADICWRARSDH